MTLILLLLLSTPQTCLTYEPDTVVLKGTIRRHTFAGPPNYESVAKGDQAETVWLLHLTQPICVSASSDWEKETGVSKLQLMFANSSQYDKALLNGKVDVTGTLYHQHTGHHHTKVLIKVNSIKNRAP